MTRSGPPKGRRRIGIVERFNRAKLVSVWRSSSAARADRVSTFAARSAHAFADVGSSETAASCGGASAAKWRASPCFKIERPGQLYLTGLLTFSKFGRLR